MNIKEMWEKKQSLEVQEEEMASKIGERWHILHNYPFEGFVTDWWVNDEVIRVDYRYSSQSGSEECYTGSYLIRFFEIDDEEEAFKAYEAYLKEERRKVKNEAAKQKRINDEKFKEGEKELYLSLKEKYGE